MRENKYLELEEQNDIIQELSSVQIQTWLPEVSEKIQKSFLDLRESIKLNTKIGINCEYSHSFSVFYFKIALFLYECFKKHKTNLDIIRICVEKCLNKLEGIRSTNRERERTQCIYTQATNFKNMIDKIFIQLENKLNNSENIIDKAKILINLGKINYQNFDFSAEELFTFKTHVLGIHLMNFIMHIEEMLLLNENKDYYQKSKMYRYLARGYQLCGQDVLCDSYLKRADKQIERAFQEFLEEKDDEDTEKKVTEMIKKQVLEYHHDLKTTYEVIKSEYKYELSEMSRIFIKQTYIKFCTQGFFEIVTKILEKIATTNKHELFMKLFCHLEQIKTILDFNESFTTNSFYVLLVQHDTYLSNQQRKDIIKQYKVKIKNVVYPKISGVKEELDVLSNLLIFLRFVPNCKRMITSLQIENFCNNEIPMNKFIDNILNLNEPDIEELKNLKYFTSRIKNHETFFIMDIFVSVLKPYLTDPKVDVKKDVMTIKGSLIVLSEILPEIIIKMTDDIKELRFVETDVFFLDASLTEDIWAGVNILLVSKTIHVQGKHKWNVSGKNGQNYSEKAMDGIKAGEDGKNGANGQSGSGGGNLYISCINCTKSEDLTIISHGGKGGNGQTGGNGMKGKNGSGVKSSEFKNLINPIDPDYKWTKELIMRGTHTVSNVVHNSVSRLIGIENTDSAIGTEVNNHFDNIIQNIEETPDSPLPKIAKKVKIFNINWTKPQFRINVWRSRPNYFEGEDENNCKITYSYYPGWLPCSQEALVYYKGNDAEVGGQGGSGGQAGSGGFSGQVEIKCIHQIEISIEKNSGQPGKAGQNGVTASPGDNGWDMAYVYIDGFWSSTKKIIGEYQDCKLDIIRHSTRKNSDFVYCPYYDKKLNDLEHYIQVKEKNNRIFIQTRNPNIKIRDQEKVIPTRCKAINITVIQQYEETVTNDNIQNQILKLQELKEQALEEIVENDEEKEMEITNFEVHRQVAFDDICLQSSTERLRKRQKVIETDTKNLEVEKVIASPLNVKSWLDLKCIEIALNDLKELHFILLKHKCAFGDKFSKIYDLILRKYKIATCKAIKKDDFPEIEVLFDAEPIENYLILDSAVDEFDHNSLGSLINFFRPNSINLASKLRKYLNEYEDSEKNNEKTIWNGYSLLYKYKDSKTNDQIKTWKTIGSLLYPLKMFILENSYYNSSFVSKSKTFLNQLNNLESKLEKLNKCYLVVKEENEESGMLIEIEDQKNKIIKDFKGGLNFNYVKNEFLNYISKFGVSSSAVRELLACAFNVNIQLFVIDQNKEIKMCHNHNPTAPDKMYLLLFAEQFVQFRFNENYLHLVTERKKLSKNYSDILNYVNELVCIKDVENFYQNFNKFNGYRITDNMYMQYRHFNENDIINKICMFFPNNDFCQIYPVLDKLTSRFSQNKYILKALLQRFETDGNHIDNLELIYICNSIMNAYVNKDTNLEIFEWIFSVTVQSQWLHNFFYIELENYFKKSLNSTSISKYLKTVKQRNIILLIDNKLKEETENITLQCISTCLEILSEINVDVDTVRQLPLSKWQYTLREQLLEYRLICLTQWKSNEQIQRALYYLTSIECNVGSAQTNKLLGVLDGKKEINAEICLDIFSLLHVHEWRLNEELLNKLLTDSIASVKSILLKTQQHLDKERTLENILHLITENSHTSSGVKTLLENIHTNTFLSMNIEMTCSADDIKEWSKNFKEKIKALSKIDLKKIFKERSTDILYMINHAIKLQKGFHLRINQKLAILLMLHHNKNTLSQINTGEGKSLIVVAVAIVKVLCGEKVDVITSSSVLAIRDAKIHKDIFDLFYIEVCHNCSEKIDERRDAYSGCPVIFGDLMNYQRDYLLDRFYDKNILGDRAFENLLVDEVDSMLLDKGNNTLYLSHEIPELDKLESVYQFIWKKICLSFDKKYENFEDILKKQVMYDLYAVLHVEDIQYGLKVDTSKALSIYNFLKDIQVINKENMVLKQITEQEAFKTPENSCIENKSQLYKLRYLINTILNRNKEIRIPKCLYKFVGQHIETWIKNGLLAIQMEEGNDYVVDIDHTQTKADNSPNITIIDKGTGTDQSNSQWEEGLHQFLQLKHGCKVSAQSLKAVFISNVSYFNMYNKLFGLTGTLGSQVEKDLLEELYQVEFVNIPTAKPKRFIEQEALLCYTEVDWQFRIVNRAKELIRQKRSVLVICETIKEVNNLAKAFEQSNIPKKQIYKREHEELVEKLDVESIIIATNLAGRGTDIKISENLNKNGGLHVLLTYLPSNARIEQQAFGRAARSGCNGSGQLVIIGHGSFLDKRENRELEERQRIANIKKYFDQRIRKEEDFFKEFSEIYRNCNNSYWEKLTNKEVKEIASQRLLDRWAFWIDEYGSQLVNNNIDQIFEDFKKYIKDSFSNWKKWEVDPVHLVKIGLYHIERKSYKDAVKVFNKVIKIEPSFCEAARYYKAFALSKQIVFEKRPFTKKDSKIYNDFLFQLEEAEKLFEDHKDACMTASVFIENLKQKVKNEIMTINAFKTQQKTLIKLYDFYIMSIRNILGHAVYKFSFISQEITDDSSEKIYKSFLDKYILHKSHIIKYNLKDIDEICKRFAISRKNLHKFLESYKNKDIDEDEFFKDLKQKIKLPNLEECWDTLVKEEKLINEKRFVIIERIKISTVHENMLKELPKADIDVKSSKGKYIFMKQYVCANIEDIFIINEETLKQRINDKDYNIMRKANNLFFNRIAEVSQKLREPIGLYDSLSLQNVCYEIENDEAEKIIDTLIQAKFLKQNSSNSYSLCTEYNEEIIPDIVPYKPYVIQLLRMNFAYRIALQNIELDLKNLVNCVHMNVINEPHSMLMWDLVEKKIIQPVKVGNLHDNDNIEGILETYGANKDETASIKNHVKCVLINLAGNLKSLEVPRFKLATLTEYLDQLQITPLQEFNTFLTNSLNYVIEAKETKYTSKMIKATIFIKILGILEIALGIAFQLKLLFFGLSNCLGSWLINEGINDLQYSISCWFSGIFNWDNYMQHKIQSMKMSLLSVFSSLNVTGLTASKFGERLALGGAKIYAEEVCQMTGKKLIAAVGKNKIIESVTTKFVLKVGEGLVRGVVTEGINHVVDSCLQNLCNQLTSTLVGDIETAINRHPMRNTLNESYRIFGKKECEEKIKYYTEKALAKPALSNTILAKAFEIANLISTICQGAANRCHIGHNKPYAKYVAYLGTVLQFSPFRKSINDITSSIEKILDGVNEELQKDINDSRRNGQKEHQYSQTEVTDFTDEVMNQWRTIIQERANSIFSEQIAKPVLRDCARILVRVCTVQVKNFGRNKYHEYVFKNIKKYKNKQIEDKSLTEEFKETNLRSYNETLMKLKAKVRNPDLYADISAETGFVDAVGLKACTHVLRHLLTDQKSITLVTKCNDGLEFEYSSEGEGGTRVSTIHLNDHHYTNKGDDTSSSKAYDCYYHSLVKDFPELNNITSEEFRKRLCNEIRQNPEIRDDICKGKHAFTINRGIYGGMKRPLTEWTVKNLVNKIQNHDFLFSQDSARDTTINNISLKNLQEDMLRDGFNEKYAINVVVSEDGKFTTLDHRRISSLTTIDNSDFKFYVREFKPDEKLPSQLQNQYKAKDKMQPDITASKAIKIRTGRPTSELYTIKDFKIRVSNWEYYEQNKEFYRRLENVGFTLKRRNSFSERPKVNADIH